jgi:hypothetical protein
MRRRILSLAIAGALAIGISAPVAAADPTCADMMGIANHGEHVLGLYVVGGSLALGYWPPSTADQSIGSLIGGSGAALPGGPGPTFHFINGFQPGASFCVPGAESPTSPPGHSF